MSVAISITTSVAIYLSHVKSYIYRYSLYIWSTGLPITRGNSSSTVPSGSDVYKRRPKALGFQFLVAPAVTLPPRCTSDGAPTPSMHARRWFPEGARRRRPSKAKAAAMTSPRREWQRQLLLGTSGDDESERDMVLIISYYRFGGWRPSQTTCTY
jgi:hypothetical protein